jgi:hypothetical protein
MQPGPGGRAAAAWPHLAKAVSTVRIGTPCPGPGDALPRRPIGPGLLQIRPCLLCAVADPSTAARCRNPPGSLAETGRGLHLFCALSGGSGYTTSGTGKVVWAMFTARGTEPAAA